MIVAPRDAIVELTPTAVRAFNFDGSEVPLPDRHTVPDVTADELGGYSSFMAKEMAEQPAVLTWQADDLIAVDALVNGIAAAETIIFTGCGSAHFAARLGAGWLGALGGKPALAIQASELADHRAFLGPTTLVCAVTQSGETADVLEAMDISSKTGARVFALTNVEHSSAARMADAVVLLGAGRERSVLATKSMTAMLGRLPFSRMRDWSGIRNARRNCCAAPLTLWAPSFRARMSPPFSIGPYQPSVPAVMHS
jgi:glucosamine--fructose-6-phosphate aminotransferase (isomerizing)